MPPDKESAPGSSCRSSPSGKPACKALSSNENACFKASSSIVNRESSENAFSPVSSPNALPVSTLRSGFSSCSNTIGLSAAAAIACCVKDAGYAMPVFSMAAVVSADGCTTPTTVSGSPFSTSERIYAAFSDWSVHTP